MAIYREKIEEAKSKLRQTEHMRKSLEEILRSHLELFTNSIKVVLQEYAEAHIFLNLIDTGAYHYIFLRSCSLYW